MKDKNKKVLKALGVGALACVGMFGLTGCANIEVSQDKFDSMIETVEKADNRLDEYIDLLEQQNQQLQEQNTNLENLLEHPEVWKQFSLSDGRSWVFAQSEEVLRETYENAKELETVTTKNYCIAGQRDEVLEYLKSREFTNIRVEKVKLSLYE